MRNGISFLILLIMLVVKPIFGQKNDECNKINLTIKSDQIDETLKLVLPDNKNTGVFELQPFDLESLGGWEGLKNTLISDENISFEFTGA